MKLFNRIFSSFTARHLFTFAMLGGYAISGCGGGSSTRTQPGLSSISVSPATTALWVALNKQQLTATGHYSDGSSKDLTSVVSWSSATPGIAAVNSSGLVTPAAAGTVSIQAT